MSAYFQGILDGLYTWYDTGVYDGISHISISIFDHLLSLDEARSMLTNVDDFTRSENDQKLHKFVCTLTSQFDSYLVKFNGRRHNNISFRAFTSDGAREKTLLPQHYEVGDKWRFVLAIPELEALYFEGDDFTHHFYSYRKLDLSKIEPLFDECGVYPINDPL